MRTKEITMKFPITVILTVVRKQRSGRTSYLTNGYNAMNYFAKFEKFLSHSVIMPSFMTVQSQMPELEEELPFPSHRN